MQVVQDKVEIAELEHRYARAVDTKGWAPRTQYSRRTLTSTTARSGTHPGRETRWSPLTGMR